MENILNYTLSLEGTAPDEPAFAGYQGEHRATAIVFTPDSGLLEEISLRQGTGSVFSVKTELVTEAGEIFSGGEADISKLSEPFFISGDMSESGLDSTVLLCITETDADGNTAEFLRASVPVYFLPGRGYGRVADKKREADILEQKTAEALLAIEGKCAEAEGIVSEGITRMQEIKTSSAEQLKKALAAAEDAESSADRAEETKSSCEGSAAAASLESAKAKEYCLAAGGYCETAGQEARTAKNAAEEASALLLSVEKKAAEATSALSEAIQYAGVCRSDAALAEDCAEEAKGYAKDAAEYSSSAVEQVKSYISSTFGDIEAALDGIIALQEHYIGGEGE